MRTSRFIAASLATVVTAQLSLISAPAFAEPPPATPAAPAAAPAAPPADGTVMVHINSSAQVVLQKRASKTASWETACTSPCDQRLSVSDEYRVTNADSTAPSRHFNLDASKGTVTLDVTPGDPAKKKTGLYVAIGAGVLTTAGVIVMIAGAKPSSTFQADGTTSNRNGNVLFAGGAMVFAGAALGIYAAALIINNGHVAVEGDTIHAGPARGALDVPAKTAQVAPNTPTFIFPVYSGSF